ncbi:hypothetical protein P7B02_01825 [Caulobacter segnis]|uniref:hypothetical protein n=1 Tax=Caulobacter segnis TaxID=88688 RepID=UPI00240F5913|nr:hypothetical protein [Caulobacter segnis]MDG2520263.1 hypothetical protein [Caulobacter segnis]
MTDSLELRAIAEQSRRKAALMPDGPARGVLEVMAREMDRDADRIEREERSWTVWRDQPLSAA